jgi:hypothetical protein
MKLTQKIWIIAVFTLTLVFNFGVIYTTHAQDVLVTPDKGKQGSDISLNPLKETTRIGSYETLARLPGLPAVIDPGLEKGDAGAFTLPEYIKVLVRIAIGVIGILAVVMIVISGVQYMGSAMVTEKEGAKQRLTGAVLGLILAVSSVLLLRTINPQLTNLSIGIVADGQWCAQPENQAKKKIAEDKEKKISDLKKDNKPIPEATKLTPEEVDLLKRFREKCADGAASTLGLPEELKVDYEREDLPAGAVAPNGVSKECTGGMVTIDTVNQKGLLACKDIAENFKNMVAAAKKDGITLTAYGGRTMESQIALRKKNCGGSSQYNVYEKPSGQCKPPTARPGKSMHQLGLAFDIGENGKTICYPNNSASCKSRGNKAFLWLEKNAGTYKLFNLPSEAWHWSVNGK